MSTEGGGSEILTGAQVEKRHKENLEALAALEAKVGRRIPSAHFKSEEEEWRGRHMSLQQQEARQLEMQRESGWGAESARGSRSGRERGQR